MNPDKGLTPKIAPICLAIPDTRAKEIDIILVEQFFSCTICRLVIHA